MNIATIRRTTELEPLLQSGQIGGMTLRNRRGRRRQGKDPHGRIHLRDALGCHETLLACS